VHEAWLRLVAAEQQTWQNRAHFFSAAAEAMRRILIDNARRKQARKHGGGQQRVDVADVEIPAEAGNDELLAVHEALDKFAVQDSQKAELVKLRYFAGLSIEEAAEVLRISVPTANRWWAYAKAWLFQEITAERKG
jgi:RNA polymerase sigma factor (TIGR02999 family)